jgi:glutaredoxin
MNKHLCWVLLALSANVHADTYYRSIDKSGTVHYGEQPLVGTDDVTTLQTKAAPTPAEALPFETQRAKAKFPVTLYLADDCTQGCKQAREYLIKRGIPFSEKKLVTDDEVVAFKKSSGSEIIPVMRIGNNWLKGFGENQWSAELDAAGYPRTAPYGVRPIPFGK